MTVQDFKKKFYEFLSENTNLSEEEQETMAAVVVGFVLTPKRFKKMSEEYLLGAMNSIVAEWSN